jgi:hypothetical protein
MFEESPSPEGSASWTAAPTSLLPGGVRPSAPDAEPAWGATVGAGAAGPESPQIARLRAALAEVVTMDPASQDPVQALVDTAAVLELTDTLKLAAVARVADVEQRRLHRLDGAPTANSWMRQHESSLSSSDITTARRLPSFPRVAAAVACRELSTTAAGRIAAELVKLRRWVDRPDGRIDGQPAVQVLEGVILHGVRNEVCQALGGLADDDPRLLALVADLVEIEQRPGSELARLEAAFVLLARHVEPDQLRGCLGMLVDALLPSELERRAREGHDDRGLAVAPEPDGSGWRVTDGQLDLELGELLHAVLAAMTAVDPENVADTEAYRAARVDGWTDADGTDALHSPSTPAPRSRRQRQHDALKAALRLLLDSGILGSRDKVAPHIAVVLGHDTLHGRPGAAPATGASGARLPLRLVRQWWCGSAVTRFVVGLGRKVIETSHTERTLKAHERRAKHLETGGRCQGAGCRCGPGDKLIPHHPDAWARTGTTSFHDSVLLCERDHGLLHQGHVLRLKDGRLLNENGWATE